ncbi:MAG: hypothetical protein GXO25_04965 [Euryarchaeota archaeon]|nr:hypothetical protein [Euryarchaeota archaeon]
MWRKGDLIIALGVTVLVLFGTLTGATALRSSNFSPSEVWAMGLSGYNETINSVVPSMDANGDGKAELMVELENASAYTYSVVLLNGVDGKILASRNFTDTGYGGSDSVAIDPTLYALTVMGLNNEPVYEHYFMVFGNHTDNKHVSLYSLSYPQLSTLAYQGIEVPSSFTSGGLTYTVNQYTYILHVVNVNGTAALLYIGYYVGTYTLGPYTSTAGEIQMILLNETLATVWERTETGLVLSGQSSIGADITDYNGWGFLSEEHPDIVFLNLYSDPGNTTITAIDLATGTDLWNITVNGMYPISNPVMALNRQFNGAYFMDYDNDKKVDFLITTTGDGAQHVNFINATGHLLGYYNTSSQSITYPATGTAMMAGKFSTTIRTIDVNGDGNGELFLVDNNTRLICWDIAHNSSVWEHSLVNQSYMYIASLSTNDLNADGIWDLYLIGKNDTGDGHTNVNVSMIDSKNGTLLGMHYYAHAISGFPGMSIVKELSDLDGDGMQDSLVVDGYYTDSSGTYVIVNATSMKDGSILWSAKISAPLSNNDYSNWSTSVKMCGDVNGDGINDVYVKMYYHEPGTGLYDTYLFFLSGRDGAVLWSGSVIGGLQDTHMIAFKSLEVVSSWNQFDYNNDGILNEVRIYTENSVYVYAVTQAVPEFGTFWILAILPLAALILRRRH